MQNIRMDLHRKSIEETVAFSPIIFDSFGGQILEGDNLGKKREK